ncbi:MAG TPA: UDP-N-acetylglucosamine 2-epimerase (non-hydrolyzing) [Candidatus Bathyarchaeia archaeon]|nr:UDP-N-acetylglucosamine 2-epimerase (non-hydrolyzing) [Candidatus Bathyarchaeia archaeon]
MNSSIGEEHAGRIATVVGTRPEIIKVAPVVRALNEKRLANEIIHTGQHYSYELDSLIFNDLGLPSPRYNLKIGSGTHAEETARALVGLEGLFKKLNPSLVLVQGDTNTTLAGALAASKIHIPVGHIEAGLRSFDRRMPEEKNRVLTDHISDILFAPTETAAKNLDNEGIPVGKTLVTGNTAVDAVNLGLHLIEARAKETGPHQPSEDNFLLLTLHREENVDREDRLRQILKGLALVSSKLDMKILFPAHPRTMSRIKQHHLHVPESVTVSGPVGFLDFLALEQKANLILTDSGGVQEEACILKVPCVTLRESTERPETIEVGANHLAGLVPENIVDGVETMMKRPHDWKNPFGDGHAGPRIARAVVNNGWSKRQ